jgi:23S rRNA (guanine745-N1)-methyltransferase
MVATADVSPPQGHHFDPVGRLSVAITPAGQGASCFSAATAHPETPHRALDTIFPALRCPICATPLRRENTRLTCTEHHSFDIARQGDVNCAHGRVRHRGDTPAMVAARERFLSHGHYQLLVETVTVLAAKHDPAAPGTVLDIAGGTGHYLASVLDALPGRHGICLDASTPALKWAARAHPRAAAIGADAWKRWPLATNSASTVLNVFAPRNAAETRRVLSAAGIIRAEPHARASHEPRSLDELTR